MTDGKSGRRLAAVAVGVLGIVTGLTAAAPKRPMGFFIASSNPGTGANLGGLKGADQLCQSLATAAGAGQRTWHAYLSTAPTDGKPGVDARSRIGRGPWYNAKGELVALNVADLHGAASAFTKQTALNERGEVVNGRGDTPNRHDILTGSGLDGRLAPGEGDRTCGNWTSQAETGAAAAVGHFDRQGGGINPTSHIFAHASRGCSLPALQSTGGDGLLYCFAAR